jgi:hypothetical protein
MITLSRLYFSELIPFARICLSTTRRMPLVEQELITLPPSTGANEFIISFTEVRVQCLVFCVVFC